MLRSINTLHNLKQLVRNRHANRRRSRNDTSLQSLEHLEDRRLLAAVMGDNPDDAAPVTAPHEMQIGTNVEGVYDWMAGWTFTDAIKHSRDWISHEYNTTTGEFTWHGQRPVAQDDRGWATQLDSWTNNDGQEIQQWIGTLMFNEVGAGNYPAGIYRMEWDGEGTFADGDLSIEWDVNGIVEEGTMVGGRHYAEIDVNAAGAGLYLQIRNINPERPLENFNFWMPDYEGQSFVGQRDWTPDAEFSPFHPLFLERLAPFETLRFTQMLGTHEYEDGAALEWSDRREVTDARQVMVDSTARGMSVEYVIELANTLQTDIWVNMPHTATPDYVERFATLVRDTLDPALKINVEWSNEVWNALPWFPAYHWITDQLNSMGDGAPGRNEFIASQINQDFNIWSSVFEDQQDRVVRVVASAVGWPEMTRELLTHLGDNYDAVSIAGYFAPDYDERNFTAATTADEVLDVAFASIPTTLGFVQEHQELIEEFESSLGREIPLVLYESGPHFDAGETDFQAAFTQAFVSPRIYDAERLLINGMHDLGVDAMYDYQYTQGVSDNAYGNFGSLAAQNQPVEDAHKYRALLEGLDGSAIDMMNARPTLSDMPRRYVVAGEALTVDFTVGDAETAVGDLTIMVDSSESLHVPNSSIAVTGTESDRMLHIQTTDGLYGRALISTLVIDADGGTVVDTFYLEIVPPEDTPPPLPPPPENPPAPPEDPPPLPEDPSLPPEQNTPPTAVSGQFTTREDEELWIELLDHGFDAETSWEGLTFTVDAVSGGSAEIVDIYSNVIFTPHENYSGPASVSWTVTDDGNPALSASGAMSITVTPVNDEPVALQPFYQTPEDVPFLLNLSDAVMDVDHAVEDLAVTFFDEWLGTIEVLWDGQTAEFVPTENYSGIVDMWFQAVDPDGAETWGSVTVEVLPVNDAPTAVDAAYETFEDESIWISVDDLVDDVETDLNHLILQFHSVHGGTVTPGPEGWNLIFTPDANFNGTASFEFTVTDDGPPALSASAHVDVNVIPVNDAPVATNGFITTQASTQTTIDLLEYASDVETPGSQLYFEVFGCCDGQVQLLSDGHSMTVTPDPGFIGDIEVWYRVFDEEGREEWGMIRISMVDSVVTDTVFEEWDLLAI